MSPAEESRGYKTNKPIHGQCRDYKSSRAYNCWVNMKSRCLRESHPDYSNYGGRGIRVCERWMDFQNFLADMGQPPDGKSLERRDNNGHYEPGNCGWATQQQQVRNRRCVKLIAWSGMEMSLAEWGRQLGIGGATLRARWKAGQRGDELFRPATGRWHR